MRDGFRTVRAATMPLLGLAGSTGLLLAVTGAPLTGQSGPAGQVRPHPGPRSCHAMAFDSRDSSLVLYGGSRVCGRDVLADTSVWLWNGVRWDSRALPGGPGAREDALLVPGRPGELVLYGGRNGNRVYRDTWRLTRSGWNAVTTGDDPGPVEHAAGAWDAARNRFVVFGGGYRSGAAPSSSTWEWDGSRWLRVATTGPAPRVAHSMAWSPGLRTIVLYGGFAGDTMFRDLWTWDGARWTELDRRGPVETEGPALFAWTGDSLVLVGAEGQAENATLRAWVWAGSSWTPLGGPGPPPRIGQSLVSDPWRRRVLLFGGFHPVRDRSVGDLWSFDGAGWTRLSSP